MKVLRHDALSCPAATTPASAARVVVAGAVAVATALALTAVLGSGAVLTSVVTVAVGLVAAVLARRTFGSLVAGAALRLARPYSPGEQVRLYVPEVGEVAQAEVIKLGFVSTTLGTRDGLLVVPNSRMLRVAPECTNAA